MDVSVLGRVMNTRLPLKQSLLPLFEAIINSIHGIEDTGREDGLIQIYIERGTQGVLKVGDEQLAHSDIYSFKVVDNGIGFNSANFESFTRADSRYKASRGGRGVGRFIWLKAFSRVEIESTYQEKGKWHKRSFIFRASEEGIEDLEVVPGEIQNHSTSVRLVGVLPNYGATLPKRTQTIALRIVEHCLEYFVLGQAPRIQVIDADQSEVVDLHDVYESLVSTSQTNSYVVGDHEFSITHFLLNSGSVVGNQVVYCANKRAVHSDTLTPAKISNITTTLTDANTGEPITYNGYISGAFLNSHVNPERTGFSMLVDDNVNVLGLTNELSWAQVESGALEAVTAYLRPHLEEVKQAKEKRISNYVETKAPEFRALLHHRPEVLDTIPPNVSDASLEQKLFLLNKEWETDLREQADELSETSEETNQSEEEIRASYNRFLEEWNDLGKSQLARYVLHRKATLDILDRRLQAGPDGKYSLEDAVHDIIFPLRSTSDDLGVERQNLWIIDEKLAYHKYLASDLPFSTIEAVDGDSRDRPDIVIFDHPIAVVEGESPFGSVVIVEFKRPMRNNYKGNSSHNPIAQVLKYVKQLKSDTAVDKNGRPLGNLDNVPFYCYIIADITPSLREQAHLSNLEQTPDHEGFFGFNTATGAYIEVISFNKLIREANSRNRVLFRKLQIHE